MKRAKARHRAGLYLSGLRGTTQTHAGVDFLLAQTWPPSLV